MLKNVDAIFKSLVISVESGQLGTMLEDFVRQFSLAHRRHEALQLDQTNFL